MNTLLIIGLVLLILWILGLVTSYTLGGYIYIALVIAIILLIVWLIQTIGRRK